MFLGPFCKAARKASAQYAASRVQLPKHRGIRSRIQCLQWHLGPEAILFKHFGGPQDIALEVWLANRSSGVAGSTLPLTMTQGFPMGPFTCFSMNLLYERLFCMWFIRFTRSLKKGPKLGGPKDAFLTRGCIPNVPRGPTQRSVGPAMRPKSP